MIDPSYPAVRYAEGAAEVGLIVLGIPAAQGSKDQFGQESSRHVKPWRASIASEARAAMLGAPPLEGPVEVVGVFVFPRPKAHFRTGRFAGDLRESAPYWHVSKPDLDKLQRAIGDALVGIVLRDDSQVARWDVNKRYGNRPRVELIVRAIV